MFAPYPHLRPLLKLLLRANHLKIFLRLSPSHFWLTISSLQLELKSFCTFFASPFQTSPSLIKPHWNAWVFRYFWPTQMPAVDLKVTTTLPRPIVHSNTQYGHAIKFPVEFWKTPQDTRCARGGRTAHGGCRRRRHDGGSTYEGSTKIDQICCDCGH